MEATPPPLKSNPSTKYGERNAVHLCRARSSPINTAMMNSRYTLNWGNPDAITIFNPGDRDRYHDLLWGTPGAITMFNPGDRDGYRDLLWQHRWKPTCASSAVSATRVADVPPPVP